MKAIRSLEQHVDSLMSYDFTGLNDAELREQLNVVDDRRIWVIAGHCAVISVMMRSMPSPRLINGLSTSLPSLLRWKRLKDTAIDG